MFLDSPISDDVILHFVLGVLSGRGITSLFFDGQSCVWRIHRQLHKRKMKQDYVKGTISQLHVHLSIQHKFVIQ